MFYIDQGFDRVYDRPIIIDTNLILSHEPILFVSNSPFINVYGHVHTCENFKTIDQNLICVCVERWNYKPISLKTIRQSINERTSINEN
jgi:calcineurin-like phosphoesterase family protein